MSLKESINADMKQAMRDKDSARLEPIRMLRATIQRTEVDSRTELDDDGVLAIVQKLVKQSKDAISQFSDGGRDDLIAKEQSDIDVWQTYLPAQLGEAEIDAAVTKAIADSGAQGIRDMGKVMGQLKSQLQGSADMGVVSARVKALLAD